jgi:nitronate monooxygenase
MLEAERAGAKALVVYMSSFERNSEPWKLLRAIQADEAHNCALIGELLKKAGVDYSHATGKFYDKAVAVKGPKERIAFLVKGLKWAVKRFEEALPRLDEASRNLFVRMRDSHLRSIAACESILKTLPR